MTIKEAKEKLFGKIIEDIRLDDRGDVEIVLKSSDDWDIICIYSQGSHPDLSINGEKIE